MSRIPRGVNEIGKAYNERVFATRGISSKGRCVAPEDRNERAEKPVVNNSLISELPIKDLAPDPTGSVRAHQLRMCNLCFIDGTRIKTNRRLFIDFNAERHYEKKNLYENLCTNLRIYMHKSTSNSLKQFAHKSITVIGYSFFKKNSPRNRVVSKNTVFCLLIGNPHSYVQDPLRYKR